MSVFTRSVLLLISLAITTYTHSALSSTQVLDLNAEKIVVPVSGSPQFSFTMSMHSQVSFFLLTSKDTKSNRNAIGKITISDQDCSLGHQVSVSYEKSHKEILTSYFPKEIPWGSIYKLGVTQDIKTKTLSVTLNDETISVVSYKNARFIYLINNSKRINMLNISQQEQ